MAALIVLLLLALASPAWAREKAVVLEDGRLLYYVLKGETLMALPDRERPTSQSVMDESDHIWRRQKSWAPDEQGVDITAPGNCGLRNDFYFGRIGRCDAVLVLENVKMSDAGVYSVVALERQKTFFMEVIVVESQPVLSLTSIQKSSIGYRCDDIRNPEAETFVRLRRKNWSSHGGKLTHHKEEKFWSHEAKDEDGMKISNMEAKCCSYAPGHIKCGSWAPIDFSLYVSKQEAGQRPWCEHSGGNNLKDEDFGGLNAGPLLQPECQTTEFDVTKTKYPSVCQGTKTDLSGKHGKWSFQHPLFKHDLSEEAISVYTISSPATNDTGPYLVEPIPEGNNISLDLLVHRKLYAALSVASVEPSKVVLDCVHNGMTSVSKVSWEVEGQLGGYEITESGKRIIILLDCWKNYSNWQFRFGVRCHVSDGPWTTSSRWVIGDAIR
ncbi:hypothetical protein RHVP.R7 [Cricetid gammaherpesvirus 2]|uniref:Uncharacterized protein n=1 Tax=Cricetid gammaherpesvirus 2 TaxID=1605972 RepID=E9M5I7_9GAMA|nr:hypothetical protein RHVP.R7 [Cricetid gammaherpesvirus 2]ADW24345.1 hypothetical protein RHVP.R7 [Cricetid gammaherpesvirus 2]ADW24427.1 hypothetical protein RHVP-L.R7 [Cricetid gammaherpesvirus 2]